MVVSSKSVGSWAMQGLIRRNKSVISQRKSSGLWTSALPPVMDGVDWNGPCFPFFSCACWNRNHSALQKALGIFIFHFTVKHWASLKLWSRAHLPVRPKELFLLHGVWLPIPLPLHVCTKLLMGCDRPELQNPTATWSVVHSQRQRHVPLATWVIRCCSHG